MSSDQEAGLTQHSSTLSAAATSRKRAAGCCLYCYRRSPFFIAVEEGDAAEVARFLREDAFWLKQADKKDRRTAWHIAAENGHIEVLRALADRTREEDVGLMWSGHMSLSSRIMAMARDPLGPEERVVEMVNGRSAWGVTPLALAAVNEQADAIKYLLSIGADPWLGDHEGRNAAHYAAKAGSIRGLQVLLQEERPASSRAASHNHSGTRYVDSMDTFGFTPLHYATWANRRSAMMLLVGFDANIIARSLLLHSDYYNLPAGSTPLHVACLLGCLDRVKLLLRAYYETAADLLPSQTAMMTTVERRRRARSHPDPRLILTRTQRLPFHVAARCGHRHLLDWLDPSVPLMFLFGGEEDGPEGSRGSGMVALVGVSRLTVIAAKALHQALLDSLDAAEEDIRRHREAAEARSEERRRRREERRTAKEAEAAAQSLKQGKEPPPDGLRGKLRRLMERASRENLNEGTGAREAGGGAETMSGWRAWRARGRRGRRKATTAGTADASAGAAGEEQSGAARSPRWRHRRGAGAAAVVRGAVAAAAPAGAEEGAAPAAGGAANGGGSSSSIDSDGSSSDGGGGGRRAHGDTTARRRQQQQPDPQSQTLGGGSLRRRILRESGASQHLQQQRISNAGGGGGGTDVATDGADPDGGGAASLTRTMLQKLYRGSLRRQSSGGASSARAHAAAAQLNERLNRAGITIPEGPDEEVAFFSPGREPRYNMPTQILLPGQRPSETSNGLLARPMSRRASLEHAAAAQQGQGVEPGPTRGSLDQTRGGIADSTRVLQASGAGEGEGVAGASGGAEAAGAVLTAVPSVGLLAGANDSGTVTTLLTELLASNGSAEVVGSADADAGGAAPRQPRPLELPSLTTVERLRPPAPPRLSVTFEEGAAAEGQGGAPSSPASTGLPRNPSSPQQGSSQASPGVAAPPPPRSSPAAAAGTGSSTAIAASTYRSMDGSSSQTQLQLQTLDSVQLPGTATEPLASIPPSFAPASAELGGAGGSLAQIRPAGASSSSRTQVVDGLPHLGDQQVPTPAPAVAAAGTAATEGGATGDEQSWGLGRVGAGARMLLNSLKSTLRRTSGQHQAQVLPLEQAPRGASPSRGYRHRRRHPEQRSEANTGPPPPGGEAADGREPPASPNTSHHRGSAYYHHLTPRGVRLASARPHARVSMFGRASAANSVDGADAVRSPNGAGRRRSRAALSKRSLLAAARHIAGEPRGQDDDGGAEGTDKDGEEEEEAEVAGDEVPQGGGVLRVDDCSSFSSTCSMRVRASTAGAAATAATTEGTAGGGAVAATAAAAGDDSDEDVCPVCLDEPPNLLVQTCRHPICMGCARDLVKRHSLTPALCPYCRGVISSFKARVAPGAMSRC